MKKTELPKKYADESVLVCKRNSLEPLIHGVGIISPCDKLWREITKSFPIQREIAEQRMDIIQLVSYFVISNGNAFLTHKRSRRQPEKRLVNIKSIGFSGHIVESDANQLFASDMFEPSSVMPYVNRELVEEVEIILNSDFPIKFVGYIWDPSDILGKQHLGLLYIVQCNGVFRIMEPGLLTHAQFECLSIITKNIDNYTTWSKMVCKYLNDHCQ